MAENMENTSTETNSSTDRRRSCGDLNLVADDPENPTPHDQVNVDREAGGSEANDTRPESDAGNLATEYHDPGPAPDTDSSSPVNFAVDPPAGSGAASGGARPKTKGRPQKQDVTTSGFFSGDQSILKHAENAENLNDDTLYISREDGSNTKVTKEVEPPDMGMKQTASQEREEHVFYGGYDEVERWLQHILVEDAQELNNNFHSGIILFDRLVISKQKEYKFGVNYKAELIGQGGQAKCFKATDDKTNYKFLVKKHHTAKAFLREVKLLVAVNKEEQNYFQKLFGAVKDATDLCIFMEYLEGVDLATYIQENPPTWPTKLQILKGILQQLSKLHSVGIVHGDIKECNVIINDTGSEIVVKIIDFGRGSFKARGGNQRATHRDWLLEKDVFDAVTILENLLMKEEKTTGFPQPIWKILCEGLNSDPYRRATIEELTDLIDEAIKYGDSPDVGSDMEQDSPVPIQESRQEPQQSLDMEPAFVPTMNIDI